MAMRPAVMVIAVVGVAFANVAMNLLLKLSARDGVRVATAWQSLRVLAAFAIGTGSVLLLLKLYSSSWSFARVMILLASTSLVLGVLVGVARGDRLHWSEAVLLALVLLFYIVTLRLRWGAQ